MFIVRCALRLAVLALEDGSESEAGAKGECQVIEVGDVSARLLQSLLVRLNYIRGIRMTKLLEVGWRPSGNGRTWSRKVLVMAFYRRKRQKVAWHTLQGLRRDGVIAAGVESCLGKHMHGIRQRFSRRAQRGPQ